MLDVLCSIDLYGIGAVRTFAKRLACESQPASSRLRRRWRGAAEKRGGVRHDLSAIPRLVSVALGGVWLVDGCRAESVYPAIAPGRGDVASSVVFALEQAVSGFYGLRIRY